MDDLSSAISACVKSDPLAATDDVPVRAQKLVAKMQTNIDRVIADAKQALREAISTAEKTREPGPLVACRDELVLTATMLKRSCHDETNAADDLLKRLREEERRKTAVGKGLICDGCYVLCISACPRISKFTRQCRANTHLPVRLCFVGRRPASSICRACERS